MDLADAVRHLGSRLSGLPPSVTAVLQLQQGSGDAQSPSAGTTPPDEDNIVTALTMINGMFIEAWGRLDTTRAECQASQARDARVLKEVAADEARLSDRLSSLKGKRNEAISGLQEADEQVAEIKHRRESQKAARKLQKAADAQLLAKRKEDAAVALMLVNRSRCPGGNVGFLELDIGAKPGPALLCHSRTSGQFYLRFEGKRSQADTAQDASGAVDKMLRLMARKENPALAQLQQPSTNSSNASTSGPNATIVPPRTKTSVGKPIEVGLVPPDRQEDRCMRPEATCDDMHLSAVSIYAEARDSILALAASMAKDEQAHADFLRDSNLQLELLQDSKWHLNEQLADATSKMNLAQQEALQLQRESREASRSAKRKKAQCTRSIQELLGTELCSLRSLRAAVVARSTKIKLQDLTDCEVSDWTEGECSMECDASCPRGKNNQPCGGTKKDTREVIQKPSSFGAQCPPLTRLLPCNQVPCPIDCQLSAWSGFSACTKECDGGVRQRTRSLLRQPKHGGEACDALSETQPCNTDACSQDCSLGEWSDWSGCSAACLGGLQERARKVIAPARGHDGTCPDPKSGQRYQTQPCNTQACVGDEECVQRTDFVVLIDSSASVSADARQTITTLIKSMIARYNSTAFGKDAARIGIVQYGNGEVLEDGSVSEAYMVSPLDSDFSRVQAALTDKMMNFSGFPNLAQALNLAERLCKAPDQNGQGGRSDTSCSMMVVAGSRPPFMYQTKEKVEHLRALGVRIFVLSYAYWKGGDDTTRLRELASAPVEANFLHVQGWAQLREKRQALGVDACFANDRLEPQYLDQQCKATTAAGCGTASAGVRCCAQDGSTCEAEKFGCMNSDFLTAKQTCQAAGMRLCTPAELRSGNCCTSACKTLAPYTWSNLESKTWALFDTVFSRACPKLRSPALEQARYEERTKGGRNEDTL